MRRRFGGWLVACVLAGVCWGCSSDDGETGPVEEEPTLPTRQQLQTGWNLVEVGGAATCARGTPYAFFVRPGSVERIVIEFEGGGACWSQSSCAEGSDMFDDVVDRDAMAVPEGIHDHDNPANPFRDWYHVFVPYCTGDLHMGDQVTTYVDFDIHHAGAINAGLVMQWVYDNFPSPERVVVTGCSAGGYGSIAWAPYVMEHYPEAPVVQLADCAAGVAPAGFLLVINGVWNAGLVAPPFVPALADPNWATLNMTAIYQGDAGHFTTQQFAQYNTQWDGTQTSFYEDMGGAGVEEWSQSMNESVGEIAAGADNFASYTAAGDVHCIITRDEVYSAETAGTPVIDWIGALASGTAVDDVHCEPDCGEPL